MKSFDKFNESIKDKMTPKPKENIRNSLYDYFDDAMVTNEGEYVLETGVFDKDIITKNELYLIFDWEDYYELADDYFQLLSAGQGNSYQMTIYNDKYTCYPDKKIVFYEGDGGTDGWYFDSDNLRGLIDFMMESELNESIRDKMTPKSKDEILEVVKNLPLYEVQKDREKIIKEIGQRAIIYRTIGKNETDKRAQSSAFIHVLYDKYFNGTILFNLINSQEAEQILDKFLNGYDIFVYDNDITEAMEMLGWDFLGKLQYKNTHEYIYVKPPRVNESVRSKMTPKTKEEIGQATRDIIDYIKEIVKINKGRITMCELEADSSPVYDSDDEVVHLIETLYVDKVEVEEYDNFAEAVLSEYHVKYEELEPHTLLDIKSLIEHGIEYELIGVDYGPVGESVRDFMKPKPKEELRQVLDKLPERERLIQGIKMEVYDDQDINGMLEGLSPREYFLRSVMIQNSIPSKKHLVSKIMRLMKPYKKVKPGDLLTVATPNLRTETDISLGVVVKKEVFRNKDEFYRFIKEEQFRKPSVTVYADEEMVNLYNKYTWMKVHCVVADISLKRYNWDTKKKFRVIYKYGDTVGVFPYTRKEIEEYESGQ